MSTESNSSANASREPYLEEILLAALLRNVEPFRLTVKAIADETGTKISSGQDFATFLKEWTFPAISDPTTTPNSDPSIHSKCDPNIIQELVENSRSKTPRSLAARVIAKASQLALGMNYDDLKNEDLQGKVDLAASSGLLSIFDEISLGNHDPQNKDALWRYPLATLEKGCYPYNYGASQQPKPETDPTQKKNWPQYWNEFVLALQEKSKLWGQPNLSFANYLGCVLSFFENYWWCLPSTGLG